MKPSIRIQANTLPSHIKDRTCRTIIESAKRFFEDPEVMKDYLAWKKQRKELSKT